MLEPPCELKSQNSPGLSDTKQRVNTAPEKGFKRSSEHVLHCTTRAKILQNSAKLGKLNI